MTLERPIALVLLLLLLPLARAAFRSRAPLTGLRRKILFGCQALAIACVALALAEPVVHLAPARVTRVVVVGRAGEGAVEPALESTVAGFRDQLRARDVFHVVRAGPRPLPANGESAVPVAGPGAPDLAAALAHAARLVPAGESGEIVLASDGLHDGSPLAAVLPELSARKIPLHLRTLPRPARGPVLVAVRHEARVRLREPFLLRAVVLAAEPGPASLRVLQGETLLVERAAELRRGTSELTVAVTPEGTGPVVLEAQLHTGGRSDPASQRERTAVLVEGRTRVLHIGTAPARRAALNETLEPHGFEVVGADLEEPLDARLLAGFGAVVVDDTNAAAWPRASQAAVADSVRRNGTGLLMAGVRAGLGPGGYGDSPLAEVLPVEMPQREERRDPSVALVIILDTSGSMGGARIELAKETARLAIRRLLPHDKVGIVEFYGSKRWAAPVQPAANQIEIQRALNRLQAGGGTIIYSALEESFYALLNVQTRFKHILVLTDGGVEQGPFQELARRMADAGMNLSTVLIGPQGNSPFLVELAQWGRGRFYACPSRFQLPELRFREPQSSLLPAVQERDFPLVRAAAFEATTVLGDDTIPPAAGLVDARLRPGAELMLATSDGRPYLAGWDQGRGRVIVLAGELLGPMSGELGKSGAYPALLADTLRSLTSASEASDLALELVPEGEWLAVRLAGGGLSTWPAPALSVLAHGTTTVRSLTPGPPGAFAARIDWPGDEPFVLEARAGGYLGREDVARGAAVRPLPKTSRAGDVEATLADLARLTGGTLAGDPPRSGLASARSPAPIAHMLAIAALVLFLGSLLVRRWPGAGRPEIARPGVAAATLLAAWLGAGMLAVAAPVAQEPAPESRPQADDPIRTRIDVELRAKGHLDDLRREWQGGTLEQRLALARAEGNLEEALALIPTGAGQERHAPLRALLLEATGKPEEALAAVELVLADPALAGAPRAPWLLRRGELRLAQKRNDDARADFVAAIAAAGDEEFTLRAERLAGSYGLHDLALASVRPDRSVSERLRRALWLERAGNPDGALAEYRDAYGVASRPRDQAFLLSRMAALQRKCGKLAELADYWLALPAPDARQQRALVAALRELGRGREALDLLERVPPAARGKDLEEEALDTAVEAGETARAVELAAARLRQGADDPKLRVALALLLTDLRRPRDAEEVLVQGIGRSKSAPILTLYVQSASELGLDAAALSGIAALRALGREKDDVQAVLLEAAHLAARNKSAEAVELLLTARTRLTQPAHRMRVAEVLESKGRRSEALAIYREVYAATRAEDLGSRLASLLAASPKDEDKADAAKILQDIWLEAGSQARRVQAEERVLDMAAREGTLADLAIELERARSDPATVNRDAKRQALVKIYTRARDSIAAAEVLKAWAQEPGKEIAAWQEMAQMYLECEEFRAHDRCLRRLLELDPEHEIDYRQQLAMSALERGRPAEARNVIREMLDRDGPVPEVAFEFSAGIFSLSGRHADAIKVYRRSLARHPDRIETLLLMGNALAADDKRPVALGMFCDILAGEPVDDLFVVSVDGLLNLGAPPSVLRFAERAVRRRLAEKPDKVYLHRLLQDVLETLKDETGRVHSMEEMLASAGEQRSIFVRELMEEGSSRSDWAAQVDRGRDLLALGEEVPPAVFLELGEAFLKLKDFHSAERAFSRARLATDFSEVERRIAGLYEKARMIKDAERVHRRILRRDQGNPLSMLAVARLTEQRGGAAEALALYTDAAVALLDREGEEEPEPARGAGGGRAAATSAIASATPLAGLVTVAGPRRNDRGPSAGEAIEGAIRCSTKSADLDPLKTRLKEAAAKAATPAARLGVLARFRDLALAFGAAEDRLEVTRLEDDALARAPADAASRTRIVDWRLADGDVDGAARALAPAEGGRAAAQTLQVEMLSGKTEQIPELARSAGPADVARAIRFLHLRGDTEKAHELLPILLAQAKANPTTAGAHWSSSMRLLGLVPERKFLDDARLEQALARTGAARTALVLAALRAHGSIATEDKATVLRGLVAAVTEDKTGNQAQEFVLAAKSVLTPDELAPVAELAVDRVTQPFLLQTRIQALELVPTERRWEVLERTLRRFEESERTTQMLALLAQGGLDPEVQRKLVDQLSFRNPGPMHTYSMAQLCLRTELAPDAARELFAKLQRERPKDPAVLVLGARIAAAPDEAARLRRQALDLVLAAQPGDRAGAELESTLIKLLEPAEREALAARLSTMGVGGAAPLFRAELAKQRGDHAGAVAAVAAAQQARPDDLALLYRLQTMLTSLGRKDEALQLMEKVVARSATVYPHQMGQIASLYLDLGRATEALEALNRVEDPSGMNARLRLRAVAALPDPGRRAEEARAFLQIRSGRGSSMMRSVSLLARGGMPAASPAQVFAPITIPPPVPATLDEVVASDGGSDHDLLGFFPEGAQVAQAALRAMSPQDRENNPGVYRGWLRSARLTGKADDIVRGALAAMVERPWDPESLRIARAAAQLGMDVPDAVVERAAIRHTMATAPDRGLLAEDLILAHHRGMEDLARRLVRLLLEDRGSLAQARLRPFAAVVLAIASQIDAEALLALLPAGERVQSEIDGDVLLGLQGAAKAEVVVEGYRGIGELLAASAMRTNRRERVSLPWCGWCLRVGDVAGAVAALRVVDTSIEMGDAFAPQAVAAALPPLAEWRDRAQVKQVQEAVLRELGVVGASEPGKRMLYLRLAAVMAIRLREAGAVAEADEWVERFAGVARSHPGAEEWLVAARGRG